MNKKLICTLGLACIIVTSTILYKVSAKESEKENSKRLINSINSITESNYSSDINKTKDYRQSIINEDIKQFENDDLVIECNDGGEPIIIYDKNKKEDVINRTENKTKKLRASINKESLIDKATRIFESLDLKVGRSSEEGSLFLSAGELIDGTVAFKWSRLFNGYQYDNDFSLVIMDPIDEKLVIANRMYLSNKPNNSVVVSTDEATKIAQNIMKNIGIENVDTNTVLSKELRVVNPNYYWTNPMISDNKESKIAYDVRFLKMSDYQGEVSVWIDSETGEVIGGQQTK